MIRAKKQIRLGVPHRVRVSVGQGEVHDDAFFRMFWAG